MRDLVVVEMAAGLEAIVSACSFDVVNRSWQVIAQENDLAATCQNKTVIMIVDGRSAALHQVQMPNLDDAKLLKILPGLVDEKIATSAQKNQFALVGKYNAETGSRSVCAIEKATLSRILALASRLGINPDFVVPDFVLLEPPEENYSILNLGDRYVVRGADGSGFSGEKNIVDMVAGDAVVAKKIPHTDWLELAARAATAGGNFLQGDYARKSNWVAELIWWKRASYLAVFAAVLFAVFSYYSASENYRKAENLYAEAENLFRAVLPEENRIVNIEAQLRRAALAQQQKGGGEFFALAAVVVEAVEADPTASLESVRYAQDDSELLLNVSFPSFAETAKFNAFLVQAGMQVTEGSSRQEGGRVYAELRVGRQ